MNESKAPIPSSHLDDIEAVKAWIGKYGSHALTAVLVVLVALTSLHLWNARAGRRAAEANLRLGSARSVADLEAILNDFGGSDVAPLASLSLAKLHFENGNYTAALAQYERFLKDWPGHDLRPAAELGRIFCIEARGGQEAAREAAVAFAAFAAAQPGHYLAPQAVFGHARCLDQLDRLDEARAIIEDFIAAQPGSPWAARAEELLADIQRGGLL